MRLELVLLAATSSFRLPPLLALLVGSILVSHEVTVLPLLSRMLLTFHLELPSMVTEAMTSPP